MSHHLRSTSESAAIKGNNFVVHASSLFLRHYVPHLHVVIYKIPRLHCRIALPATIGRIARRQSMMACIKCPKKSKIGQFSNWTNEHIPKYLILKSTPTILIINIRSIQRELGGQEVPHVYWCLNIQATWWQEADWGIPAMPVWDCLLPERANTLTHKGLAFPSCHLSQSWRYIASYLAR